MYDKNFKYKVVKAVLEGKSHSAVGRDFHIPQTTVSSWMQIKDELIRWHEEQHSAKKVKKSIHTKNKYSLEEKALVLLRIKYGEEPKKLAQDLGIPSGTIHNWVIRKDELLDVYFRKIENRPLVAESKPEAPANITSIAKRLHSYENGLPDTEETVMARKKGTSTLEERQLRKENEYLKTKVAYLETLMELNGLTPDGLKKKVDSKPSTSSATKGNTPM